jgi:hypothetical protein
VILAFCTLCVEIQGESAGLSMKCFSPLFSEIEHYIELIVSMNDINSFMYNFRGRKSSTQACTPPCNFTKEYIFDQAIRPSCIIWYIWPPFVRREMRSGIRELKEMG